MKQKQAKQRQLLFLVGGIIVLVILGVIAMVVVPKIFAKKSTAVFRNPAYTVPFQREIAQQLHLSVAQVTSEVVSGKTIIEIAQAEGISLAQLHTIELNGFQHLFNKAVSAGDYVQSDADQVIQQFRDDTPSLDTKTLALFGGAQLG